MVCTIFYYKVIVPIVFPSSSMYCRPQVYLWRFSQSSSCSWSTILRQSFFKQLVHVIIPSFSTFTSPPNYILHFRFVPYVCVFLFCRSIYPEMFLSIFISIVQSTFFAFLLLALVSIVYVNVSLFHQLKYMKYFPKKSHKMSQLNGQ